MKKEIKFELIPTNQIVHKTRDPLPTARHKRLDPYKKPKHPKNRRVVREMVPVQIETQLPNQGVRGDIRNIVIIQGQENIFVNIHYKDGSVQPL